MPVRRRPRASISEISFDYRPGPPGRTDVHRIIPCIDTVPLLDLVDSFELNVGMQPAGGAYGGIVPRFVKFGSAISHFHGTTRLTSEQKTPVLACECGELACWPMLTRITLTGDLVVWDRFQQPYRPTRDYGTFGPFLFDRDQYDSAVRTLTTRHDE